MNFIYRSKLLISSYMKLVLVVLFVLDVVVVILYSLNNTTSLSTISCFLDFFLCSLSLYKSCISLMLSSMYLFPFPLYASNLSASIH